ncbi:hypothetical protein BJF80_03305 [Serinicoccus sp. CUA-874]|uniref:hypothetical protein n=1 Tax=Serinicoccus sp. CUA-874 TaxID=1517939 RepID=UPI0009639C59|nr:hypothetical protein [Serinicoccus sp. CUA-874]OLT17213.1 hypothetical protein BJF80_03305 [Serinicoccus sp. CUA-874]
MLYLNRDQIGIPEDLPTAMLPALHSTFAGAQIQLLEQPPIFIDITPVDEPSFSVCFYFPHMASCDGTTEQQALVALCMAQECRKHGIRIVMASDDASFVCAVEEGDTVADLLEEDRWKLMDTEFGEGDVMQSPTRTDQRD